MAEEKKDVEEADIADTVGPAANYAIAKNFLNFESLGPIIEYDLPLLCDLKVDKIKNLLIILELLRSINFQNQINRSY